MGIKDIGKTATTQGAKTAGKAIFTNPTSLAWILVGVLLYVTVVAGMGAAKGLSQTLAQLPKYCGNIPTDVADAWDNFTDWLNGTDDCEACAGTTEVVGVAPGSAEKIKGNENLKRIYKGLLAAPFYFSSVQAAAVVGNFAHESSGDPVVNEYGGGGGWGLAQWTYHTRKNGVKQWIRDKGKGDLIDKGSLSQEEQFALLDLELGYVWDEMVSGDYGYTKLKKEADIAEATRIFEKDYENPAPGSTDKRIAYAKEALAEWGSEEPEQIVFNYREMGAGAAATDDTDDSSGDSSSSGGCGMSGVVGDFSGDEPELAKKIIDSGKFTSPHLFQVEAVAAGDMSCPLHKATLQMILIATQVFDSVYVSSLNRNAGACKSVAISPYWHTKNGGGRAVDFAMINGQALTGGDEMSKRLITYLYPYLPKGGWNVGAEVGQTHNHPQWSAEHPDVNNFSDSHDHQHVAVPDVHDATGLLVVPED